MSEVAFAEKEWQVVSTVLMNTRCRHKKSLNKCGHEWNNSKGKICSFETCPVAVDKLCLKGNCMFKEKTQTVKDVS